MSRSTLNRLYSSAKSGIDADENFTTEVLAAAIKADPGPFLSVLQNCGLWLAPSSTSVPLVDVATQVIVPNAGVIDLVAVVRDGARHQAYWIEVKIRSPESGRQLEAYRAAIAARDERDRPALLLLAPRQLADSVPWIPWQALREASLRSSERWWHELRVFLEERGMMKRVDDQISAKHVTVQNNAWELVRKTAVILRPAVEHLRRIAPELEFVELKSDDQVARRIGRQFSYRGDLVEVSTKRFAARLYLGVFNDLQTGESWLGIDLVRKVANPEVCSRLVAIANANGLPGTWERSPQDGLNTAVRSYERLVRFESTAQASTWLVERAGELHAAGILQAIPGLGSAADDDDDDEP